MHNNNLCRETFFSDAIVPERGVNTKAACEVISECLSTRRQESHYIFNAWHRIMEESALLANMLETASGRQKIEVLLKLAAACFDREPQKALDCARQARDLAESVNDKCLMAMALNQAGRAYALLLEYDKALSEYQKALALASPAAENEEMADILSNIGNAISNLGRYEEAIKYFMQAVDVYKMTDNTAGLADSLNNIGVNYQYLSDYQSALEYHLRTLGTREEIGERKGISESLKNIGIVYAKLGKYQDALKYNFEALKIFGEMNDKTGSSSSLNNIGIIYKLMNDYDKSLEYHLKSLEIVKEIDNKKGIAGSLNNIGAVYFAMKRYDKALECYLQSCDIKTSIHDKLGIASSLVNLGNTYAKLNEYEQAVFRLEQGLQLAQELKAMYIIQEGYATFADLHESRGDYRTALEYYKKYTMTKDSIFTEDSSKKIAEMQTKYETEKKEKEAEIYRLRNVELAEANQAITQAKEIIEEKNRHITSSIEYARRIQQAVLPPAGKMQAALPEHFVLFKPRDIVSGDFYWFSQTGGKILIAVVDCTGHGVPGAFMSMIGSMLLNTIVNENGETSPAKILTQLHVAVRSALKQHDAEADTTDGMDVCLCAIDQKAKQLVYAGAKRPLYIVRNKEMTEIAGDGKSVGGRQKEEKRAFSDNCFELQDGDMLYLTSDGYSDQCDPEGRKIGSRRLKELLQQVSRENYAGQRAALLAELEAHQATEEQRDDIAIVGIRI